ncbi:Rha family transcriptional regulator [Thiorhodococcus minor]|uniref:Uncharacterized protein n=1 Tax=Thiorhodococcus minor TaxID=57489 RepID=A0A6M0JXE7_9GAMM|nr:Rha family transcriptional regulator [Thiorhodococcus minor]NEV61651.1 hypothetical protein [Thiorhodococcus minor]
MKNALRTRPANIIENRHSKPMVSSLTIADLFSRRHDSVLRAIRAVLIGKLGLRICAETSLDVQGKERPIYWLEERDALTVMPFIGGKHAMDGQRQLVDAYLAYRDSFANPPRQDILRAKRASNRPMLDALIEAREEIGKATDERHYMCEAKLCNWVITGRFEAIDEATLSNVDAELLEQVRDRNRALILAGLDYQERKARLSAFATRQRTRMIQDSTNENARGANSGAETTKRSGRSDDTMVRGHRHG